VRPNTAPTTAVTKRETRHEHDWSQFVSGNGTVETWRCACGDELICYEWEHRYAENVR
jgi:hypothetical protein